jgi:hypothetical protein
MNPHQDSAQVLQLGSELANSGVMATAWGLLELKQPSQQGSHQLNFEEILLK